MTLMKEFQVTRAECETLYDYNILDVKHLPVASLNNILQFNNATFSECFTDMFMLSSRSLGVSYYHTFMCAKCGDVFCTVGPHIPHLLSVFLFNQASVHSSVECGVGGIGLCIQGLAVFSSQA